MERLKRLKSFPLNLKPDYTPQTNTPSLKLKYQMPKPSHYHGPETFEAIRSTQPQERSLIARMVNGSLSEMRREALTFPKRAGGRGKSPRRPVPSNSPHPHLPLIEFGSP